MTLTVDSDFIASRTTRLALRDGAPVLLRPIVADDKAALVDGFERLSEESRYRRFMGNVSRLTPELLRYLTEIDYSDHFAWVAFALAEAGTPGVGVGRYVKLGGDSETAEAAVTVVDDYQGRGLGTLLLEALGAVALENAIRRFRAYVLTENRAMIEILRSMGARLWVESPGVYVADIDLPLQHERLEGSPLYEVLRRAARGELPVVHRWQPEA